MAVIRTLEAHSKSLVKPPRDRGTSKRSVDELLRDALLGSSPILKHHFTSFKSWDKARATRVQKSGS